MARDGCREEYPVSLVPEAGPVRMDLRLGGESSADTTRLLSSPFRNPGEAKELVMEPTGPLTAVCL